MPPTFHNQSVIITGASHGIGRELAKLLAAQGAWLTLAARRGDLLEEAVRECTAPAHAALGARAQAVVTDVTDPAQCQALIAQAAARFGKIDMLVNNAGRTMWTAFADVQDLSIFEQVMRVNYFGSLYCTYYALPYLRQSKGRIVAVSSLAGKAGIPTRSGYSASKHAMVGFFDSLRVELDGSGVSVTVTYPGFVATGIQEHALGADGKPLGKNPVRVDEVMTVETCARLILRAAEKRKREEVMTARGKLGQWLKLIAPGLVDRIARKAIAQGK